MSPPKNNKTTPKAPRKRKLPKRLLMSGSDPACFYHSIPRQPKTNTSASVDDFGRLSSTTDTSRAPTCQLPIAPSAFSSAPFLFEPADSVSELKHNHAPSPHFDRRQSFSHLSPSYNPQLGVPLQEELHSPPDEPTTYFNPLSFLSFQDQVQDSYEDEGTEWDIGKQAASPGFSTPSPHGVPYHPAYYAAEATSAYNHQMTTTFDSVTGIALYGCPNLISAEAYADMQSPRPFPRWDGDEPTTQDHTPMY